MEAWEYISFFFSEEMYYRYNQYLNGECFCEKRKKIEELSYRNIKNKVLLNINNEANIVNKGKLEEMKLLASKFGDKELNFISGEKKGICMTFPISIENIEYDFFSFLLPYNYWGTTHWVRYVSGFLSDILLKKREIIEFSHEMIILNEEKFDSILDIYEMKYGKVKPILEYKDFFEENIIDDLDFLYNTNVYITRNSIKYIEDQISNI